MEELKLIMQTLAGLGETAKEGFIWWLVIDKLVPTILWGAFGGGLIYLGVYIARKASESANNEALAKQNEQEARNAIAVIRGILGVYTYAALKQDRDSSIYTKEDFKTTIDAVRAVKGAASAKQEQA